MKKIFLFLFFVGISFIRNNCFAAFVINSNCNITNISYTTQQNPFALNDAEIDLEFASEGHSNSFYQSKWKESKHKISITPYCDCGDCGHFSNKLSFKGIYNKHLRLQKAFSLFPKSLELWQKILIVAIIILFILLAIMYDNPILIDLIGAL